MSHYQHILCPIDFSKNCRKTLEKALKLKQENQAKLTVVHYIEPLPPAAYAMGVIDYENDFMLEAKKMMTQLAKEYQLAEADTHVESGKAKHDIADYAKNEAVDLIVIGSHGHHGILNNLVGSTTTATINHAHCDVYIVKADQ